MLKGYFVDKDGQVYYYNDNERKFEKMDMTKDSEQNEPERD